jgi:hypothetical protein
VTSFQSAIHGSILNWSFDFRVISKKEFFWSVMNRNVILNKANNFFCILKCFVIIECLTLTIFS